MSHLSAAVGTLLRGKSALVGLWQQCRRHSSQPPNPTQFAFTSVPNVRVRRGAAEDVASALQPYGLPKQATVLIVTDAFCHTSGLISPATTALRAEGYDVRVFDAVIPDPPESIIIDAIDLAKEHDAKAVVGMGGGSSMDVAKLCAYFTTAATQCIDDDTAYGVNLLTERRRLPLVQVPTTAGTGSEATGVSIVTVQRDGVKAKKGIVSSELVADAALLDGTLLAGLPAEHVAFAGVDAIIHAVEAATSFRLKNHMSDSLATRALQLMSESLVPAVAGAGTAGEEADAYRETQLVGSYLAGLAFGNAPVAAIHALAYPIGAFAKDDAPYPKGVPHGLSVSLMSAPVMRYNAEHSAWARDIYANELLPHVHPSALQGVERADDGAEHFVRVYESIARQCNVPSRISDVGIRGDDVASLAEQSQLQTRLLVNNPVAVDEDTARLLYVSVL